MPVAALVLRRLLATAADGADPRMTDRPRTPPPQSRPCAVRPGIVDSTCTPCRAAPTRSAQYMAMPWRDRYQGERRAFYNNPIHGSRLDSVPADGGPKGSDPDLMREQLIDEYGVAYAILISRTFCNIHPDPDYAAAIASAFNGWLVEQWLDTSTTTTARSRARSPSPSRTRCTRSREIERWAGHPHIVQVTMDSGARAPFGQRMYHPIYEACERHGLPLAIHPGTEGMGINHQPTPGLPDALHRVALLHVARPSRRTW